MFTPPGVLGRVLKILHAQKCSQRNILSYLTLCLAPLHQVPSESNPMYTVLAPVGRYGEVLQLLHGTAPFFPQQTPHNFGQVIL